MVSTVRPDESGMRALSRLRNVLSGDSASTWKEPVTALLLHDPERHDALDEQVRWLSSTYNKFTGDHLRLFMVNDSREAFSLFGRNDGSRDDLLEWLMRPDPDQDRVPVDTQGFRLHGLAQMFGVEPAHLPGLVVFLTNQEGIHSRRRASFVQLPQDNPVLAHGKIRLIRNEAMNVAAGELSEDAFHQILGNVGWELEPIQLGMKHGDEPWGRWGFVRAPGLNLLGGFPNRWERRVGRQELDLMPWIQDSDEDTGMTFRTALALWRVYEADARFFNCDQSPIIMELAKGFERSVAMSVVQAARAAHEIEMPRWFGLYKPNHVAKERAAMECGVDLNAPVGRNRSSPPEQSLPWMTTTLGQSRVVYSGCVEAGHLAPILPARDTPKVLSTWETVGRMRNPVAHYAVERGASAERMWDALSSLAQMGFPQRLGELRRKLSPGEAAPIRQTRVSAHLTFELPKAIPPQKVQSRHELKWTVVADDRPLRILLSLDLGGKSIDLEPVELTLRRPFQEDEVLFGLLLVSVLIVGLGNQPELPRLQTALERLQWSHLHSQSDSAERRRRAIKEAVRMATADLQSAMDSGHGFAEAIDKHGAILRKLKTHFGPRLTRLDARDRVSSEALAQVLPEVAWQIQHASVIAKQNSAGGVAADLMALITATEAGTLGPEEALTKAFTMLGVGHPSEDMGKAIPIEIRRLCGSLRHWSTAVEVLRTKYGPAGGVAEPYFLLKALRSLPESLDEQQLRALTPDSAERAIPDDEVSAEPLKRALSERFSSQVRLALAGKPGFH